MSIPSSLHSIHTITAPILSYWTHPRQSRPNVYSCIFSINRNCCAVEPYSQTNDNSQIELCNTVWATEWVNYIPITHSHSYSIKRLTDSWKIWQFRELHYHTATAFLHQSLPFLPQDSSKDLTTYLQFLGGLFSTKERKEAYIGKQWMWLPI